MKLPELIWDRWRRQAEAHPARDAIIHWIAGEEPFRWTFAGLHGAARAIAGRLRQNGIRAGQVCAIMIRHDPWFYPIYLGVCYLGALPAVLAYPNPRLHPEKFVQGLDGMSKSSGLDWLLTERALEPTVRPLVERDATTIRGLLFPLEWVSDLPADIPIAEIEQGRPEIAAEDPLLLQHSSGTTGLQKAVALSHRAVLDHVDRYGEALQLTTNDRIASWLPLYHDMGLIAAFHLPLATGIPTVQIDPFQWVQAPILLLEAIAAERCTLAWLPNFAYNLMTDAIHEEDLDGINLESVRLVINCSEPVRAESHRRFFERFSRRGLQASALGACYAMAEATFAVTQTTPGSPARTIAIARDTLGDGLAKPAAEHATAAVRLSVSSGRPLRDCRIRILDDTGLDLPEGRVGEIAIQSASLFSGYTIRHTVMPATDAGGWYHTGDLGFLHDGEYYIVGRKKDVIIVAGQNIHPEDIEDAVSEVDGVIPGRSVAIGEDDPRSGTEQIAVIAETALESIDDQQALRGRIAEAVMGLNLTVARIHLVPPRWLIKSSSGKPSRRANQARLAGRPA